MTGETSLKVSPAQNCLYTDALISGAMGTLIFKAKVASFAPVSTKFLNANDLNKTYDRQRSDLE